MDSYTREELVERLGEPLAELETSDLTKFETSLGYKSVQWLIFNPAHDWAKGKKILAYMGLNKSNEFYHNSEHSLLLATIWKRIQSLESEVSARKADIIQMSTRDFRPVPTSAQITNSRLERKNEELRKSLREEVEKRKDRERKACMWWAMWKLPRGFRKEIEQLARERAQSQEWNCFEDRQAGK